MPDINYLSVLLAALSAFVIGGLWYSVLFGKPWMRLTGQSEATLKSGNPAVIFGGAFLLNLVAAFVLAMFIGRTMDLQDAASAGFAAGLCWVATSLGVNYLFERRPLGLWLINGGYVTVHFTVMGAIIGAMS
jgi:Protein of unknown function (DUF1761)